jgi:hypothetical protein
MDYPGKVITKTQVTPTQTSASGNWTVDDAIAAVKNNNWPIAGVPNPISKSLRFNSPDTAYFTRTPGSAPSNADVGTWSFWVKRTKLGAEQHIFGSRDGANVTVTGIRFTSGDAFELTMFNAGTAIARRITTQVFRDPSAWYHFVVSYHSAATTASQRVKIYLNGLEITVFSTSVDPTLNQDMIRWAASGIPNYIGNEGTTPGNYGDYYLTETNYIDGYPTVGGTTYDATSWAALNISTLFGMTNPQTGQWIPKKYTGTYGTNGFYLNFKDATSTTTLGYDYSGNANNWTPTGFVVSPVTSAGNDSVTDVPTPWVAYNTTGDVGGVVRGNYCTMNPLQYSSTYVTLNNGNLNVTGSSGVDAGGAFGTAKVNSGKWYWEATIVAVSGTYPFIGFAVNTTGTQYQGGARVNTSGTLAIASPESFITLNGSPSGTSFTTNDVLQFALDMDNGKMWIGKNGTWMNSGVPASGTGNVFSISDRTQYVSPFIFSYNSSQVAYNFGQRQFGYTPPTGFRSLCTTNLPPPTIGFGLTNQGDDYFNVLTYTGNGTDGRTVTGVGFNPDLVWVKGRSNAGAHVLADAVRGSNKNLYSNLTDAETNPITGASGGGIGTVTTDGFVLEQGTVNMDLVNTNARTYVAWNWKANGAGSTNSNGTAKSSSVTVDSGTDTVTWNSHGMSDGQKIGFFAATMPGGLSAGTLYYVRDAATNTFKVAASSGGAAIDITSNGTTVTAHTTLTSTVSANTTAGFSIVKHINSGAPATIEHGLGVAPKFIINKVYDRTENWRVHFGVANKLLILNTSNAEATDTNIWNNTNPTSNVFSIGTYWSSGDDVISYCFTPVAGYSAFGTYTGNNSTDGPFIYLGFRPKFWMVKRTDSTGDWYIYDSTRSPYNAGIETLAPSQNFGESSFGSLNYFDLLSNGMKIRQNSTNGFANVLNATYIYAAFAESPFQFANAR